MKKIALLTTTLILSACSSFTMSEPLDPSYMGKWLGPEGTYLLISQSKGDGYNIQIKDLDGVVGYFGKAVDGKIEFSRNGHPATIRKGTGAETGMKWLADKKDCLIVRDNEGYCRD